MQHVLQPLATRAYRLPGQRYEVATAAFVHLTHTLELALRAPLLAPPLPAAETASGARQPPAYLVLHDLLGE